MYCSEEPRLAHSSQLLTSHLVVVVIVVVAGFDPIKGANVSEISVRDVKQGAGKKYGIRVETGWVGLWGRGRGPSEDGEEVEEEEEGEVRRGQIKLPTSIFHQANPNPTQPTLHSFICRRN